jgi:hypothetical protein
MQMPIEFEIFENFCTQYGYKAVDQRREPGSGNIYYVKTRNGVKVEIKAKRNINIYVAGQGLSSQKLDLLKTELKSQGMVLIKENAKHLLIELQDDILNGFLTLVNNIEDIDGIVQRQAYARLGVEYKTDETYIFIAETLQNAIKRGQPWAISRGFGGFDNMDNKITVGYSIKGRQQELNGKNAYREHIVPCDLIMRKGIEMIKAGNTIEQVATMFANNNFILKISDDEAYKLDIELGLRTIMPEGWDFGQDVYSRINFAEIQLETPKVDK